MNVINCRDDIKAGCYTRLFFFMFSHTSTTDILKNHGTHYSKGSILIWKGWRLCNFVLFHNSNTLSHTWCTLYMSVHATFFIAIEKRVWINQNYHLVNFMSFFRFETFLWIRYIRDLKDRKKLWWRQARVSIIQF